MGQRYGREPIVLDVCADCGAYVADREVHNDWHHSQPALTEQMLGRPAEASFSSATGHPFQGAAGLSMGPSPEAAQFGRVLFTVAQEHLDPGGRRLQWSLGFSGSAGPAGAREWGCKFGWAKPNDTGQAMVYVAVGDIPPPDRHP